MTFQSTVRATLTSGVVGGLAYEGPLRAQSAILRSVDAAYNVVGRYFTVVSEGVFKAGGTGAKGGILANPKTYSSNGTTGGGPLAPTLTLPNEQQGEFVDMGILFVNLPAAAAIGDLVQYDTTTGALSTVPQFVSGTGAIATTTLTISAVDAGSGLFAVGQIVSGANIVPGTRITALGTGTGGTGTYTVNVSQTAASAAVTSTPVATTGNALVPNCKVSHRTVAAAGLAIVTLTN
jgi:hypothetical protein